MPGPLPTPEPSWSTPKEPSGPSTASATRAGPMSAMPAGPEAMSGSLGSVELESIVKVSQGSSPVGSPCWPASAPPRSEVPAGPTIRTMTAVPVMVEGGAVVVSVRPGSSLLLDGTVQGVPTVGVAGLSVGGNAADLSAVGNQLSSAGGRGGKVGVLRTGPASRAMRARRSGSWPRRSGEREGATIASTTRAALRAWPSG